MKKPHKTHFLGPTTPRKMRMMGGHDEEVKYLFTFLWDDLAHGHEHDLVDHPYGGSRKGDHFGSWYLR